MRDGQKRINTELQKRFRDLWVAIVDKRSSLTVKILLR